MDATAQPGPLAHREARLIVMSMMVPVFMGSMDQTILASALPAIGRQFGDVHNLPWLIAAYLITSTASTPLYGKVSDIHGRRFALAIALGAHLVGSLLCALSGSLALLIVGRAVQGLGGGGLTSTGMVVLGDVAAPKERARYYGYFSVTYTTAGACGPALGGFLADYLHWSAIFWLNVPLELFGIFVTLAVMKRLPRHDRPHRLDLVGAVLIVLATVAFMLALTSGGVQFAWDSTPILALTAAAAVIGGLFVARLLTAPEPLIPLAILKDPAARCSIAANALGWGGVIGLNIFLPVYLQDVLRLSATSSGLSLMVLMAVLNASAGLSSVLIGRHRRYKTVPLIGLAAAIAAVLVLAWRADRVDTLAFEVILAVLGIGFGPLAPLTTVCLQNAVAPYQFGTAVGTMTFLRTLTAMVLVAVFGAIVLKNAAHAASAANFQVVFLIAAGSIAAAFVALLLLEERPLTARHDR